ncbi:sigma-70 factor domain-containing protein, partial [uncultured Helicobacter sp.]
MSAKNINQQLDELFQSEFKYVSYEKIAQVLGKLPTAAQAKRVSELAKKYNRKLMSASEVAKILNQDDARKIKEDKKRLLDEELEDEFDFMKERELLEWSRSDSPVRMYLREMGQIPLLTREDEVELSKNIELGENIILDAICSVPYLIDFILDYKEALINRERRVKELFKSFDDDEEEGEEEDLEEEEEEESENEKGEDSKKPISKKDQKRVEKVLISFKALEKAKKDWLKTWEQEKDNESCEDMLYLLTLAHKKQLLKEKLLDLGPTSKLINELVKAMENTIKSDEGFEKELKRLEYRLPLFNDILLNNHKRILDNITEMSKA